MKTNRTPKNPTRGKSSRSTLYTVSGLEATQKRRKLRPFEKDRLSAMRALARVQAEAKFARRVKYALGRGKSLPAAETRKQERIIEREVIAKGERPKRNSYKSGQDKLRKKFHVHSRKGVKGAHRVWNVPFSYKGGQLTVDIEAIRAIFRIEDLRTTKTRLVNIRAFVKVKFKAQQIIHRKGKSDMGIRWFPIKSGGFSTLADSGNSGADGMHTMILETILRYEVSRVLEIEIQSSADKA